MENLSIWKKELIKNNVKKLNSNKYVDVLIIGGGVSGLSCAYYFLNSNLKVCVVEKNIIGSGITANSTAKISFMQEDLYNKIENIKDHNTAKLYYEMQKEGINNLINIIKTNNIECDLKKSDSYIFTTKNKDINKIKHEKNLLESFSEKIDEVTELPDGLKIKYGIKSSNTYTFHPIKYLNGLKSILEEKIPIYENTCVTKITKEEDLFLVKANNYNIKCKYIVLATHYPYFLFPYLMPLKCSLEKSYIGLYKDKSNIEFQGITYSKPTLSIRYIDDLENKYKLLLTNSKNLAFSQNDLENFYPIIINKPDYIWSNIDIITKDYIPYIGSISKNLYILTGYNTWGFTNGTIAGNIIFDIINNNYNKYIELTNPKRVNLKTIIKYPLYMFNSVYTFTNSKLLKNKYWYSKNVKFKKIDGVNVGIYKDQDGNEYIVKNKCPHLGCSLIFNETELTWDCPCHASRFDIHGNSISGPSNYNITFNKKS